MSNCSTIVPSFISDCTNVYYSPSGDGCTGNYNIYASAEEAAQNCMTNDAYYTQGPFGYGYYTTCGNASTTDDYGDGYISDGYNIWAISPPNQGDSITSAAACSNPVQTWPLSQTQASTGTYQFYGTIEQPTQAPTQTYPTQTQAPSQTQAPTQTYPTQTYPTQTQGPVLPGPITPFPQFAPNPNVALDLSGPFYQSDCTYVYGSQNGGGGDMYTTPQDACYSCGTTIYDQETGFISHNNYNYGGTCASAPTTGAANTAYMSDCRQYFQKNASDVDQFDPPNYSSPYAACSSCISTGQNILNSGNGYTGPVALCASLPVIPTPTSSSENFMLFENKSAKTGLTFLLAFLVLAIIAFVIIRYYKK
jgi:hypothetical protein